MPRSRARLALQIAFTAIVLWYFGRLVAEQWSELRAMPEDLHPDWWRLAGSGVVVLASYAVLIETWRRTVGAWGERLAVGDAARIWFVSNLGRYVPGKVWQIGAMGILAERAGISGVAAVGSSLVVNVVNVFAGFLVVLVAGPTGLADDLTGASLAAALVVFAAATALAPWLLPRVVRIARRLSGREIPEPRIPPGAVAVALAGCVIAWVLYGLAFQAFAVALFGRSAGTPSAYVAVFTLSYLIGYLVLFAPGGIGVREFALASLLARAGLESGAAATLLVLASRLWLTALEAAPGLLLLAVRPSKPTTSSTNGPETDRARR